MANIFKTTLKKDVIVEIANGKREVRFPITKFWATRLASEYNLNKKTFVFKDFDSLELSSPSNKDTTSETFIVDFIRTFVDGDEFVVEFKMVENEVDLSSKEDIQIDDIVVEDEPFISDDTSFDEASSDEEETELLEIDNDENVDNYKVIEAVIYESTNDDNQYEIPCVSHSDVFTVVKQWFDKTNILENLYASEDVIATKARQVIVRPNGAVLGSKKTLPVNNDVNVRIEFDMSNKIYFDPTFDISDFEDDIYEFLGEIRKNNFVFVWKEYTGIFMDKNGIYFGIKYSTRKSIGFKRRYNVQ